MLVGRRESGNFFQKRCGFLRSGTVAPTRCHGVGACMYEEGLELLHSQLLGRKCYPVQNANQFDSVVTGVGIKIVAVGKRLFEVKDKKAR